MSTVIFYGDNKIETAQTTSMAILGTYLAWEQNYRILLVSFNYNDTCLKNIFGLKNQNIRMHGDLESGITGLIKAVASNKTSPEIITNYTDTILKDRLEILTDGKILFDDYEKQKKYFKSILKMADKFYDLVFVDFSGDVKNDPFVLDIINEANLIVSNTTQRIDYINDAVNLLSRSGKVKPEKVIYLIGKYDRYSKYNIKNLRYLF